MFSSFIDLAFLVKRGADLLACPVQPRADRAVRDAEGLGDLLVREICQGDEQQHVPFLRDSLASAPASRGFSVGGDVIGHVPPSRPAM